jgi:hypothetical protein
MSGSRNVYGDITFTGEGLQNLILKMGFYPRDTFTIEME